MGSRGNARKADRRCETIRQQRHPSMMLIPACDNCRHRKNSCCVSGRKRTAFEWGLAAGKERVVERGSGGNIAGAFPASDRLHRQVDDGTIGVGFSSEQRSVHLISIMPSIARNKKRHGHRDYFRRSNQRIEDVVHIVQITGVSAEIGHHMRIGHQQSCGCARNRERRKPVAASHKLSWKEPNIFLIMEEIFRQRSPRYFSVEARIVAMPEESALRRSVRQIGITGLCAGAAGKATQDAAPDYDWQPRFPRAFHRDSLMQSLCLGETRNPLFHSERRCTISLPDGARISQAANG